MKIILDYPDAGNKFELDNVSDDTSILDLKIRMKQMIAAKLDSIELYTTNNTRLVDNHLIRSYDINNNNRLILRIDKSAINVEIDVFLKEKDKLCLNLSSSCSIFMLKHIIHYRTKIEIKEQSIYLDNKLLQDHLTLSDVIVSFNVDKDSKSNVLDVSVDYTQTSSPRLLKLRLLQQQGSKIKFGLDFSFNYLKSLKKIGWDEEAPSYREITDGLCLICYCHNPKCPIYNQMFVHNLGSGKFEVIEEISIIFCEKCCGKTIEVRNIGFVNCEWQYKGILKQNPTSRVSGEGKTMDKKLHTFKEVNIYTLFTKLYINVSEIELKSSPTLDEGNNEDLSAVNKGILECGSKNINNHEENSKKVIEEILSGKGAEEHQKSKCLIF